MAIVKKYWVTMIISIFFWCILNESFKLTTLLVGLVVALLATILVAYIFTDRKDTTRTYRLPVFTLIKYILVLIFNIFKSAWTVIHIILYDDDYPMVVTIETKVKRDWPICLIANGITLTPGTITIDVKDNQLTVLWLNPTTKDPKLAAKIIQGDFEKALMNKEEKNC